MNDALLQEMIAGLDSFGSGGDVAWVSKAKEKSYFASFAPSFVLARLRVLKFGPSEQAAGVLYAGYLHAKQGFSIAESLAYGKKLGSDIESYLGSANLRSALDGAVASKVEESNKELAKRDAAGVTLKVITKGANSRMEKALEAIERGAVVSPDAIANLKQLQASIDLVLSEVEVAV